MIKNKKLINPGLQKAMEECEANYKTQKTLALAGVAVFAVLVGYGAVINNPFKLLSGAAGVLGSSGTLAAMINSEWVTKKRIRNLEIATNLIYSRGKADGVKYYKDTELPYIKIESFNDGFKEGETEAAKREREKCEISKRQAIANAESHQKKEFKTRENRYQQEIEKLKTEIDYLSEMNKEVLDRKQELNERERDLKLEETKLAITSGAKEAEMQKKEIELYNLQSEFARYKDEMATEVREKTIAAYDAGAADAEIEFKTIIDSYKIAIKKQELEKYELKLKLDKQIRREHFEKSLPSIAEWIKKHSLNPFAIYGGQGAGKGTTAISILRFASLQSGCIAVVYDNSEGGDVPTSTWSMAGIPSVSSPKTMLEILRAIFKPEKNGDRNKFLNNRIMRNGSGFETQPPIFLLFDELETMLAGVDTDDKKEFLEYLTLSRTQGAKRGIYPIMMTQSYQIQNSSKLLNTGLLSGFYKILLNRQADEYAEKYLRENQTVMSHINAMEGFFRAFVVEGNNSNPQPIKHPSHHGKKSKENLLDVSPEPPLLSSIPEQLKDVFKDKVYFPATVRFFDLVKIAETKEISGFSNDAKGVFTTEIETKHTDTLKQSETSLVNDFQRFGNCERLGELAKIIGIKTETIERLIEAGHINQKESLRILGVKPGGSARYKAAKELLELLEAETTPFR